MSKGGSTPTEQTVTQTNIPKEFMPYFERLMGRVEAQSLEPYTPYQGQRLATSDQFADIGAARDLTRSLVAGGTPEINQAQRMTRTASRGILGLADQDPFQFSQYGGFQAGQAQPFAGFQAGQAQPFSDFSEANYREFNFDPAGEFTGDAVSRYMDPYMQNVVEAEQRKAQEDYDIARQGRSARAVSAGAFGGSRAAVQEGMAERALLDRQGDIQSRGLSAAYSDASRLFEADRAARMGTQQAQAAEAARVQGGAASEAARVQAARAAELARTQGINIDEAARVQAAQAAELARTQGINIDEAARIQAGQAAELARVQGAQAGENRAADQFGLDAYTRYASEAGRLAGLGEQERAARIQNAQLLDAIGQDQQAEAQQGLDIGYQDFLREQGYSEDQLAFYSDILRGLPVANAGTTTTTGSVYTNPMQQALGAGLSALSLYRAFQ